MNLDKMSELAASAVGTSANSLKGTDLRNLVISNKGTLRDIVTDFDVRVEEELKAHLELSGYLIFGEETSTGKFVADGKPFWAIDPIDGTVNFVHGLEYFGVSVGLCSLKGDEQFDWITGAVSLPQLNQNFYVRRENEAFCGDEALDCRDVELGRSLVAGCFSSSESNKDLREKQYLAFGKINESSRGALRMGSASAQISFTAQNKIQVTYGLGCKIWDVAGAIGVARHCGASIYAKRISGTNRLNFIVGAPSAVSRVREILSDYELL